MILVGMGGEASRREMESFSRELVESGFATSDTIIGCDADEIAQVLSMAPGGFAVPGEYRAFLECMGRAAGSLFRGTDLFFPRMLDSRLAAVDVSGAGLSLEDRFFFGHHQGYKVYFFEIGSEGVYCYHEGQSEVVKLADGFLSFLQGALQVQRKTRDSTMALRSQRSSMK